MTEITELKDQFNDNPFLQENKQAHKAIPFDRIKQEHFLPALELAIDEARIHINQITANSEEPSFDNTILPLEFAAERMEVVAGVYFVLFSAHADESFQKLAGEISPQLAAFASDINLNEILFKRVKSVYENLHNTGSEEFRLTEKYYKGFVRNGAQLTGNLRDQLRALDQELSVLGPQFSENVLKDTNSFELHLENENDLDGLPSDIIQAAREEAEKREKSGYIFTLQGPSFLPFITYSKKRQLREKMYRAFRSRAFRGDNDNSENIKKIASLRQKRAELLGFPTHAAYILEERMAGSPDKVIEFLDSLLEKARPAAEAEIAELKEYAEKTDGLVDFAAYDIRFYSEKLRLEKFNFDEQMLRPYFPVDRTINGLFQTAQKLFGLSFEKINHIPVYHEEVMTYEVKDSDGSFVGLFYVDLYPRETKKSGAWMTAISEQGLYSDGLQRPHIGIVCNFTRPSGNKPSLLSMDEVRTLFHEFGHALHGLLSDCTYRSLSGTNVYWDFVELPSQLMENWVLEKETLDLFAAHYETGEKIPEEWVEKLKDSRKFLAGISFMTQLSYAYLDLAFHSGPLPDTFNLEQFENDTMKRTQLLPAMDDVNFSSSFAHIFAGGYSAGYYSYKWAEVLEADAYALFEKKGIFDRRTALSFRKSILERGNTKHPADLFKEFRGREPDPEALLKRDGLLV